MSRSFAEDRRLLAMSYPVNPERLECFQSYLEVLRMGRYHRGCMYRAMEKFAQDHESTSPRAYDSHRLNLISNVSPTVAEKFGMAYRHFQEMCESGYRPGEPIKPKPRVSSFGEPIPDSEWKPFGLKRDHPARVLYNEIFRGIPLQATYFRRVRDGEWAFEGDILGYRVQVSGKRCVFEIRYRENGFLSMRREYDLAPDEAQAQD